MKIRGLIVALGLAAVSGVASAQSGVQLTQSGDVAQIQGRSGIPPKQSGAVVTRSAEQVVPGPAPVQGKTAIAVGAGHLEVNSYGRS